MTRLVPALLSSTLLYFTLTMSSIAAPTNEIVQQISSHVVKVQVSLANGRYGLGSGVVIAADQVVTNCHVVSDAVTVTINSNGENYKASALKSDWHHDLCILTVAGLKAPIAPIGSSEKLKYEQPVYTVGYATASPRPNGIYGFVKGLYPMDNSVVIRTSNAFSKGDSGGGMFDDAGNLVGIVTVKSPGKNAYYYVMPVEWLQAITSKPAQPIISKSELPFWAQSHDKWPFFMKVVQPLKTENWAALEAIATAWAEQEPHNVEATFYRAVAEFSLKNTVNAELHLNEVVASNSNHTSALYYLGLIAEQNGKHTDALNLIAALDVLDVHAAKNLKLAMGIKTD
jgi:serine protease Do